jgi:hypothetical protein
MGALWTGPSAFTKCCMFSVWHWKETGCGLGQQLCAVIRGQVRQLPQSNAATARVTIIEMEALFTKLQVIPMR